MAQSETALSLLQKCKDRNIAFNKIAKEANVSRQYIFRFFDGDIKRIGADRCEVIIAACNRLLNDNPS